FRGHKYSLYEGGVRVPAMLSWPGHLDPGRVLGTPLAAMDIFPTLLTLTGIDPTPYEPDGVDIWPVLKGEQPGLDRNTYWRPHDNAAIRNGDWKLVRENGAEPLHNLADDLSEKDDLSQQQPARAEELRHVLQEWEATIP